MANNNGGTTSVSSLKFTNQERSTLLDMANPANALRNQRGLDFAERIPTFHRSFLLDAIACPKSAAAKSSADQETASFEQQPISRNSSIWPNLVEEIQRVHKTNGCDLA